jgi:hypothetical protein
MVTTALDSEHAEALVESVHCAYREEVAQLKMQLVLYRRALVGAGIEPPDRSGEDLLELVRCCNAVVTTTSEVIHHLGSAKELELGW